jgi:hypothetical protein
MASKMGAMKAASEEALVRAAVRVPAIAQALGSSTVPTLRARMLTHKRVLLMPLLLLPPANRATACLRGVKDRERDSGE